MDPGEENPGRAIALSTFQTYKSVSFAYVIADCGDTAFGMVPVIMRL
jgi:hypothetical protein